MDLRHLVRGSIPAHAGKPVPRSETPALHRVYPRPCGETQSVRVRAWWQPGLSPPMRGNQRAIGQVPAAHGSIPAHAGKPIASTTCPGLSWVYPRPCGETRATTQAFRPMSGLSPPMRGNLDGGRRQAPGSRVYPRPCGETRSSIRTIGIFGGLSPPMRGNPRRTRVRCARQGSIPAHAGKPGPHRRTTRQGRVYPRPCGETLRDDLNIACLEGLSPPMRGNPDPPARRPGRRGSIPAHAGKPNSETLVWKARRVYPRPCGETLHGGWQIVIVAGLSPPMRGNLPPVGNATMSMGSIPAHAGKPSRLTTCTAAVGGLSPPMRGNPCSLRSIA